MSIQALDLLLGSFAPSITYTTTSYSYVNSNTDTPVYTIEALVGNTFGVFFEIVADQTTFDGIADTDFTNGKIKIFIQYTDDGQMQTADYVEFAYLSDTNAVKKVRIFYDTVAGAFDYVSSTYLPTGTLGAQYQANAVELFTLFKSKVLTYLGSHGRRDLTQLSSNRNAYIVSKWAAVNTDGSLATGYVGGIGGTDDLGHDANGNNIYYYAPTPYEMTLHAIIKQIGVLSRTDNVYADSAKLVSDNFYNYLNHSLTTDINSWSILTDNDSIMAKNFIGDIAGFVLSQPVNWDPNNIGSILDNSVKYNTPINFRMSLSYVPVAKLYSTTTTGATGTTRTFLISLQANSNTYNGL